MRKGTRPCGPPAAASSTIDELQKAMFDARAAMKRIARLKAKLLAEFETSSDTRNQPEAAREAEDGGRRRI